MGRFQTQTNLAFDFYQFYLYTALNSTCILMCSQAKYMLIGTDFWLKHPLGPEGRY